MAFPDYSVHPSCAHLTFYPGPNHPLTCFIFALSLSWRLNSKRWVASLNASLQLQWTHAWRDQYCTCLLNEWTNVQGQGTRVPYPLTDLAGPKLGQCLSWFRKAVSHFRDVEHLSLIRIQVAGPWGEACWHMSRYAVMFKAHNYAAFQGDKTEEEKFRSVSDSC